MPATDTNGSSKVSFVKNQETAYLKEITAPKGYLVESKAQNIKLNAASSTVTVSDKEPKGNLTIYKMGEVL